ncbi:hypothetical protein F2Q68_00009826 [Brassica cretica]|uniref:Uncharacterized protein n=1 Tax=Brassica cretica TaxID=69181 RepID=A0A8S9KVW4_BRACR|nr:hypothetical protein F2Q68_00009826 [Brassica cretica]
MYASLSCSSGRLPFMMLLGGSSESEFVDKRNSQTTSYFILETDAIKGSSLKAYVTAIETFSNIRRLQLLERSDVSLIGDYELFSKDLRCLCWLKFPLDSIPANLHLGSLVVMDLQYISLKILWDNKTQVLKKLKYFNLSHAGLHKMMLLNLKGCTELSDLPLEIYTLKSLKTIILSGCSKLERLDDALGKDYTHSQDSPQAALSRPFSLHGLSSLMTLRLGSCNLSDQLFPESFPSLGEIDLGDNNFRNLQTDFAGLPKLPIIRLDRCSGLQSMLSLPKELRSLHANESQSRPYSLDSRKMKEVTSRGIWCVCILIIIGKNGGTLRSRNSHYSIKGGKDKETDNRLEFFSRQGFLDYY